MTKSTEDNKAFLDACTRGAYDKDCQQCIENYGKFYPSHNASSSCESGKRPHCTCDYCF